RRKEICVFTAYFLAVFVCAVLVTTRKLRFKIQKCRIVPILTRPFSQKRVQLQTIVGFFSERRRPRFYKTVRSNDFIVPAPVVLDIIEIVVYADVSRNVVFPSGNPVIKR